MKAAYLLLVVPLFAAPPQITVRIGKAVTDLPTERYVAGVLAGESSVFQSHEALKAMAVAARTYAIRLRGRHSAEGFDFCDTAHCQRVDLSAAVARMESIAAETAGELLWFGGKPAFTPYTGDCGGRTEDAAAAWPDLAAPYLRSRADEYCGRAGESEWQWTGSAAEIAGALQRAALKSPKLLEGIVILERTSSGRARTLSLAGVRISASSFRFAIGRELGWNTVRSDRYEVYPTGSRVTFKGSGAGHGVGLCQRGADQMGRAGRGYREILAYYYPGTLPGTTAQGIAWQRLGGENIALLTVRPDRDRFLLGEAQRALRRLAQRTGWPAPDGVEVRVYPDVDTFRNATGEPGWVAGYTEGRQIHLQPNRGAELAHEVAHVLVESQAVAGLPLWFREGLAGYLEGSGIQARMPVLREADLRERKDAASARRAYADARAAVGGLVMRYGEAAVLDWVKRGLPPEVRNASSSKAAPKRK